MRRSRDAPPARGCGRRTAVTASCTAAPPEMPLPVHLDRPGQLVAAVDRRDRVAAGGSDRRLTISALDVGLERGQDRVQVDQPGPGLRSAARSRSPRPGWDRARPRSRRRSSRMKKASPIGIWKLAHTSSGMSMSGSHSVRLPVGPVLGIAGAQRPAALAHALDPPLHQMQQVAVVVRDAGVAEIALLAVTGGGRRSSRARTGQPAQAGHHLRTPAGGDRLGHRAAAGAAVLAHGATATLTVPCSRSSGTGSSCNRSSSIERPARGRKKLRLQCGHCRAPSTSAPEWRAPPQPAQLSR